MKTRILTTSIVLLLAASPALADWAGVLELRASESFTARCPVGYRIQARHEDAATSGRDLLVWCAVPSATPRPSAPTPQPSATIPPLQSPLSAPAAQPLALATMPPQ